MRTVKSDSIVKIQYKGTLENGDIFDMCDETNPFEFEIGSGLVIQAFENELIGMKINEKKKFEIPCEKAYGRAIKNNIKTFPRSEFEDDSNIRPDDIVAIELGERERTPATITKISDESVSIDMNHPLSGKNLAFEVKLLDILDSGT
jgi:peptidylprolyl isomerase